MTSPRIPETTLSRVLDGETVLVNLASGEYYSLDDVGSYVWSRLEEGDDAEKIVAALLARYDASRERVGRDTARLLEELRTHGLVESVP